MTRAWKASFSAFLRPGKNLVSRASSSDVSGVGGTALGPALWTVASVYVDIYNKPSA